MLLCPSGLALAWLAGFVFFFLFSFEEGNIYFLVEMLVCSVPWVVNLPFSSVFCKFCDDNFVLKVQG